MASKGGKGGKPNMKNMVKELKTVGINAKEAELEKPNAQTMKHLFEALIAINPGCNKFEQHVVAEASRNFFAEPELHQDAMSQTMFYVATMELMHRAGVSDMSLRDLTSPDPARVCRILERVINFLKYRNEMTEPMQARGRSRLEPLLAEFQQLQQNIAELQRRIEEHRERQMAEQPEVESIAEEVRGYGAAAAGLVQQREGLAHANANLGDKQAALDEQLNKVKRQVVDMKEECMALRRQIVESPERLQQTLEALQENIAKCHEQKEEAKKEAEALVQRKAQMAKAIRKVIKVHQLMENAERELQSLKEARARAKSALEQQDLQHRRNDNLKMELVAAKDAERSSVEEYRQAEASSNAVHAAARRNLEQATAELARVQQGEAAHSNLMALKKNKLHREQEQEEMAVEGQRARRALHESRLQQLQRAILERQRDLAAAMKAAPTAPPLPAFKENVWP